ncbi:MAG: hypothetical protein IPH16_19785 [Haliscomenobacter sp.]|nr:hypothetical protein [Haliscomenobacter sp.]
MSGNQHLLRIDREITSDISEREHRQFLETIRKSWTKEHPHHPVSGLQQRC